MKIFNLQSSIFNSERAFTIIELLVAMTLFVTLVGVATGAFIKSLRTQRAIVALMEANDNATLTLEQMAREIRTGYNFVKLSPNELQFVNANNLVVWYRSNSGAIERGTENVRLERTYKKITADTVKIANFNVALMGEAAGDGYPPRITISLSVATTNRYLEGVETRIQTTVSARTIDT